MADKPHSRQKPRILAQEIVAQSRLFKIEHVYLNGCAAQVAVL